MLSRRGGRTTDDLRARPALHEREIPPLLELNRRNLTAGVFPDITALRRRGYQYETISLLPVSLAHYCKSVSHITVSRSGSYELVHYYPLPIASCKIDSTDSKST